MRVEIADVRVGQVQVVMDGWPPAAEVERVTNELLQLVPVDCVRALKGGSADASVGSAARGGAGTEGRVERVRMYGLPRVTVWDRGTGDEP